MSAEDDMPRRRAEFGRKMRVRRITGGIQIATGIVAVILLFVVVGVIGSGRAGVIILWGCPVRYSGSRLTGPPIASPNG